VRDEGRSVIAYLKLQFSADVSLPQAPAFTFIVPQTLPTNGVTYWLAFIDPVLSAAGWQLGFEGPATVSAAQTASGKAGTQVAFASNGKPLSFLANQTYYFAVYAVSSTTATPTPVPSSIPSNTPAPKPAPVVASPSAVQFAALTDAPVTVTFSQQGYTGTFRLSGDCTGVLNTSGASPSWTLTPVGQGRCVVIGLGDRGATAVVHVGVVTPYETPHPNPSPQPSHSPEPTQAPTTAPSHSPEPTEPPESSPTPKPTSPPTTAPTTSPSHEPTQPPSPTPRPSTTPKPTYPPTTSPSPEPTQPPSPTPRPSTTPKPTPTPTPTSTPSSSPSPGANAQ
jgi:hypothetical protein